jgi:hypothetical protein
MSISDSRSPSVETTVVLPTVSTRIKLKVKKDSNEREVKWSDDVEDNEFKPMRTSKSRFAFY